MYRFSMLKTLLTTGSPASRNPPNFANVSIMKSLSSISLAAAGKLPTYTRLACLVAELSGAVEA